MSAKASVLKPCGKPLHTNTLQRSWVAGLDNRRSYYKLDAYEIFSGGCGCACQQRVLEFINKY